MSHFTGNPAGGAEALPNAAVTPPPHGLDRESSRGEAINEELKSHVGSVPDWEQAQLVTELHGWAELLNLELGLGAETPALRVEKLRRRRLGTYREGRNGLGLRHEITINSIHAGRPRAALLLTLFHELLHGWQALYGRPGKRNYHNLQFREKASTYGVVVDDRGVTLRVEPGSFTEFLTRHGVDLVGLEAGAGDEDGNGGDEGGGDGGKQKKWSCRCTNVRAAVELLAYCLRCEEEFRRA